MNHTDFFKLISSGALTGAYFLHGEEEFVKESAVRRVSELVPEEFRAFNLTLLHDAALDRIIESCETLPVFSDRSVVILRGLASSVDTAKLTEYLLRLPETTLLLIVVQGKADERSALVKFFIKQGKDVCFNALEERDVIKWCMKTAVSNGVSLDQNAARTFVGLVGTDMTSISNELQKAIDSVGPGGTITAEVISRTTIGNIEYQIFGMLDCFTAGKVKDGMRALHNMLEQDRDAPLSIAGFLESRFKLMLIGKKLMETGLSPKAAAARMEGNSYGNEKSCRAAAKYSVEELTKLVSDISLVNYKRISAGEDPIRSIERIMIGFNWTGERRN